MYGTWLQTHDQHHTELAQNLQKKHTHTQCIIDNSGVGAVEKTSSKNSDFANQNVFDGGCHILGGVCQLDFCKNCQRMA